MKETEEEEQVEECAKIVEEVCGKKGQNSPNTVHSEYAVRALEEFRMHSSSTGMNNNMNGIMSARTSPLSSSRPQVTTRTGTGTSTNTNTGIINSRNENDIIHRPDLTIPVGEFQVHVAQ